MSNVMRFGDAELRRPGRRRRSTPPAGPEKNVLTGSLRTAPGDTAPPFDCMTRGAPDAEIGDAALEALEIAVHDRHQARVHGRGGEALELAELGQHVGRRAQIRPRARASCTISRARSSCAGFAYACSIADRHRLDVLLASARDRARAPRPRRAARLPLPSAAMRSPTSTRQSRERGRRRLQDVEVEVVRPALARELEHVAETRGRDDSGARAICLRARRSSRAWCRARGIQRRCA